MAEGGPDWLQIAALYGVLVRLEPTPVVGLNHAVAIAEAGDPVRALAIVEGLAESLHAYQPWHAARAALLARTGATGDAIAAYGNAIALATTPSDVHFLGKRLALLRGAS
jgi:RNA polymerase sigma-70 factor (ECF subfamily)